MSDHKGSPIDDSIGNVVRRDLDMFRLVATLRWVHLLIVIVGRFS